jgi:hypothetical protein
MLLFKNTRRGKAGRRDAYQLARELDRRVEQDARERTARMLSTFKALQPGWQEHLDNDATYILEAARIRHAIQTVIRNDSAPKPDLCFQTSSLFLRDCHRQLTSDPNGNERLVVVTGTVSPEGVRVLSRLLTVDMEKASAAYVRANPTTTHAALVRLVERDGHQPLAMWHSHIMHGANSTRPSGIDIANQERFCSIGWDETIGGIFSLDGFFRAFSTARDFQFHIYGRGAEIISQAPRETVIKIEIGGKS